jgi:hypothetical protein
VQPGTPGCTPGGTTVRARFAWDALLAAHDPASPLIMKQGARR